MKLSEILLCTLSLSFALDCIGAVGTVTEQLNAPPSIQRQKTTLTGTKGTGVEMADAIKTTRGKVGITFADNTRVQVNENSRLVIDDFVYDPKSKAGKVGLNMALGTVRYASGAIAHNNPQSVGVRTPSATISVRGTDFTATVDELGQSTIILLPSCPTDRMTRSVQDIEKDCKTGEISVESDAGQVILNQPFQATRVDSRTSAPIKPVILKLSEDAINNMLIVSPPKEFKNDSTSVKAQAKGALDIDFLAENKLIDVLDKEEKEIYQDKLSRNFLDSDFLANILDIVNAQLAAQLDMLNKNNNNKLLPDWIPTSGVTVELDEPKITLCRDSGSDSQCITTPTKQNTTITQIQGAVEVTNRINSGGSTTIILIQR
jgi:hypothetical protein